MYWRAKKRFGARAALWLSAFFAFNPAVLVDSAAWGQMDSVYTLLIALCAIEASDEKYVSPLVLFAISLAGQAADDAVRAARGCWRCWST